MPEKKVYSTEDRPPLEEWNLGEYREIAEAKFYSILDRISVGSDASGRVNLWGDPNVLPAHIVYPRLYQAQLIHGDLSDGLVSRQETEPLLLNHIYDLAVVEKGFALNHDRGTIIFTFAPDRISFDQTSFDPGIFPPDLP